MVAVRLLDHRIVWKRGSTHRMRVTEERNLHSRSRATAGRAVTRDAGSMSSTAARGRLLIYHGYVYPARVRQGALGCTRLRQS